MFLDGRGCAGCAPLAILSVTSPSISPEMVHTMTGTLVMGCWTQTWNAWAAPTHANRGQDSQWQLGEFIAIRFIENCNCLYEASLKSLARSCCPGKVKHVLHLLFHRWQLPTFCKTNCYWRLPLPVTSLRNHLPFQSNWSYQIFQDKISSVLQ